MIVVSELAFSDGGHVPFNAGLLAVVRAAFPLESVCFAGAHEHIRALKEQAGETLSQSIQWREIILLPADVSYFSRLIRERTILQSLLKIIPEGTSGLLLLANAKAPTLIALKWITHFRFRDVKVQFVLHGQLSGVVGRRHRHPIQRFQEMKTALTIFGNDNIQYIVLEESLRTVLTRNLSALERKVEVLPHPLPPNEIKSIFGDLKPPIRFGFLGLASTQKGFPIFAKLAQESTSLYHEQVEFHAIGRVPSNESMLLNMDALGTKPGMERLSRQDYVHAVEQLHFIIFPYLASNYELNSSGTLLDALAWAKPLIARKIPLFEDMFLKYGDIGYLFSTDEELLSIVGRIVQGTDVVRYRQQCLNFEKAQCSRSPQTLSLDFKNMCEKIGYHPRLA